MFPIFSSSQFSHVLNFLMFPSFSSSQFSHVPSFLMFQIFLCFQFSLVPNFLVPNFPCSQYSSFPIFLFPIFFVPNFLRSQFSSFPFFLFSKFCSQFSRSHFTCSQYSINRKKLLIKNWCNSFKSLNQECPSFKCQNSLTKIFWLGMR